MHEVYRRRIAAATPPPPRPAWPVWSSPRAMTCAICSARGRRPSSGSPRWCCRSPVTRRWWCRDWSWRRCKQSAVTDLGLAVRDWVDGDDPYQLVAAAMGGAPAATAVTDSMPALHLLPLADVLGVLPVLATDVLRELRMVKDAAEVDALRKAGAAIDRVHARVPEFLVPGRTEADVAADIAEAIVAEGHSEVAFVIVGSGPHGADPHHEYSDREIRVGDIVVVDIGGAYEPGYNSDSTRTYSIGEPSPEVAQQYSVLQRAQRAAVDAVRPGVTAEAGRRRCPRCAGRRRTRRVFRAPHRARHRVVGARGALHRRGQ